MVKKSLAGLLIVLISLSFFIGVFEMGVVSAQEEGFFTNNIIRPIRSFFETGATPGESEAGVIMRLFFFALLVILIYSVLTTAKFPEQTAVRAIISAVVGFLAIVYITPEEFYAIMQSYTALGIALLIFLPIAILIFFTLTIGEKAAFALVFTRVLWLIYSFYLFWKGLFIYVVLDNGGQAPGWLEGFYTITNSTTNVTQSAPSFVPMVAEAAKQSQIMAFILMGVGVIIFYFGVINHSWINLFKTEMTKAQIESYKNKLKKSTEFVKSTSEAVEEGGE
jgi:hypothetical protein